MEIHGVGEENLAGDRHPHVDSSTASGRLTAVRRAPSTPLVDGLRGVSAHVVGSVVRFNRRVVMRFGGRRLTPGLFAGLLLDSALAQPGLAAELGHRGLLLAA